VYMNLSEWEGFGIPVIEAMSCGLPVLTHGLQGPGEIVPYTETLAAGGRDPGHPGCKPVAPPQAGEKGQRRGGSEVRCGQGAGAVGAASFSGGRPRGRVTNPTDAVSTSSGLFLPSPAVCHSTASIPRPTVHCSVHGRCGHQCAIRQKRTAGNVWGTYNGFKGSR